MLHLREEMTRRPVLAHPARYGTPTKMNGPLKTLLPECLHLQTIDSGVWLHFKTESGKRASINLSNPVVEPVVLSIIKAWAMEYADGLLPKRDKTQVLKGSRLG